MRSLTAKIGRGFVTICKLEYPYNYISSYGSNSDDSYSGCLFGMTVNNLEHAKELILIEHRKHMSRGPNERAAANAHPDNFEESEGVTFKR